MGFEPQGVGAEVKLTRPFEAAAALTYLNLSKKIRISQPGEYAASEQVLKTADSPLSVLPRQATVWLAGSDAALTMTFSSMFGISSNPLGRLVILAPDPVQRRFGLTAPRPRQYPAQTGRW